MILLLTLLTAFQAYELVEKYREPATARWENDIRALERLDSEQPDPEHAVLFLGSSSIRLWKDIHTDMAPWPCIQRGYGGARFSDLMVFVDRLVKPHRFDAAVIFVANDISGKADLDKTPQETLEMVKYVVDRIENHDSQAEIFLIAVTPTPSRFKVWPKIEQLNNLMAEFCQSRSRLHFIATAEKYLTEDGMPREELFLTDRLHQNRDGYRLWSSIIKDELAQVLK